MNLFIQKLKESIPNIRILRKSISYLRKKQILWGTMSLEQIRQAEETPEKKTQVVAQYEKKHPKTVAGWDQAILRLYHRAPYFEGRAEHDFAALREDMLFCRFSYGFLFREYVWYELEGKDYAYRSQFISCRDKHLYQAVINDMVDSTITIDKVYSYKMFQDAFDRDAVEVSRPKHLPEFLEFVRKHPVFVKKAVYFSGGEGVKMVDSTQFEGGNEALFQSILSEGKTLVEELLMQDGVIKEINPGCVNTVRIVTFATRNGIKVPVTVLRVGRGDSFVDNAGSGGIFSCIDPEIGICYTDGADELGRSYPFHPDSGIRFKGFKLPDWSTALEIVKENAKKLPTLKAISWDLAYAFTEGNYAGGGWKLVEVNAMGDFINQIASKQGAKEMMIDLINDSDTMVKL